MVDTTTVLIVIVIAVGLFLALREFFCWYFKINKRLEIEQANNRLLKKLLEEKQGKERDEDINPERENH